MANMPHETRTLEQHMPRKSMVYCGGYNPRTRGKVGQYHRWNGGHYCQWCGRSREQALSVPPSVINAAAPKRRDAIEEQGG
jgi:hypothetical protein